MSVSGVDPSLPQMIIIYPQQQPMQIENQKSMLRRYAVDLLVFFADARSAAETFLHSFQDILPHAGSFRSTTCSGTPSCKAESFPTCNCSRLSVAVPHPELFRRTILWKARSSVLKISHSGQDSSFFQGFEFIVDLLNSPEFQIEDVKEQPLPPLLGEVEEISEPVSPIPSPANFTASSASSSSSSASPSASSSTSSRGRRRVRKIPYTPSPSRPSSLPSACMYCQRFIFCNSTCLSSCA